MICWLASYLDDRLATHHLADQRYSVKQGITFTHLLTYYSFVAGCAVHKGITLGAAGPWIWSLVHGRTEFAKLHRARTRSRTYQTLSPGLHRPERRTHHSPTSIHSCVRTENFNACPSVCGCHFTKFLRNGPFEGATLTTKKTPWRWPLRRVPKHVGDLITPDVYIFWCS